MVGLAAYLDQIVTQNATSLRRALDKSDSLRDTARRAEVDEHGGGVLGRKGDTYAWPTFGELDMRRSAALGPGPAGSATPTRTRRQTFGLI